MIQLRAFDREGLQLLNTILRQLDTTTAVDREREIRQVISATPGAAGATGATGPQGADGATGATGATGAAGSEDKAFAFFMGA